MTAGGSAEQDLIARALAAARDTRFLSVEPGARHTAGKVFGSLFGSARAVVVADQNTFEAAGRDVQDGFSRSGCDCARPFVFPARVWAESSFVQELQSALEPLGAIPVAVGSGTLNDLTKLAAHRLKLPYMTVATAASMDGYTAFGASITHRGSKQTFDCPAPAAVLADLEVIARSPAGLNAAGYADLLAKCAAGGDWMLAEAAGEDPIDRSSWNSVQGLLKSWLASPRGIAENDPACLRRLVYGLLMSGFAMQALQSSRPASGAEHQFSHLWDMQHHSNNGAAPSHGFKVGIGTLASLALYDQLLRRAAADFDLESALAGWPSLAALEGRIAVSFGSEELAAKARQETRAKYLGSEMLRTQLVRLRAEWPRLQSELRRHLFGFEEGRAMLREAGCPGDPELIGISRERLRTSYGQAYFIRRRYTVLDFAERWGMTGTALDAIFGEGGPWTIDPNRAAAR